MKKLCMTFLSIAFLVSCANQNSNETAEVCRKILQYLINTLKIGKQL